MNMKVERKTEQGRTGSVNETAHSSTVGIEKVTILLWENKLVNFYVSPGK